MAYSSSLTKGNVFPSSSKRQQVQVPGTGLITVCKHTAAIGLSKNVLASWPPAAFHSACCSQGKEYFRFSSSVQTKSSGAPGLHTAALNIDEVS